MTMTNKIIVFSLIAIFSLNFYQSKADLNFRIIVNKKSEISTLSKSDISKLFLKKQRRWENGEAVKPVDLKETSAIRENFSKNIHGRKISSIKAYWQKQIFTGKAVPPPEKQSAADVIKYVEENEGAIGYIADDTSVKKYAVKAIKIED